MKLSTKYQLGFITLSHYIDEIKLIQFKIEMDPIDLEELRDYQVIKNL